MKQDYQVSITRREHAELLAVPRDESPLSPNEVAGRTLFSLISAGTELASAYQGNQFPSGVGYAATFQVEAVGAQVQNVRVGDVAFCMGEHRSYQRHQAEGVLRVPDGLAPAEAVFARLMSVSMSTLTTTMARPPDQVVVAGLGPVGHLAARLFASCGYDVWACDPDARRRELALQAGLTRVAPAMPLGETAWQDKTALVVECSGQEAAALDGCRLVVKRGEVVLVGVPWKRRSDLSAHEILQTVFHRYVILRSGWEWELPLHPTEFRSGSIWGNLRSALQFLHQQISVAGLFSLYSPTQCQEAYQALLHHQEKKLAIVFDWNQLGSPSQNKPIREKSPLMKQGKEEFFGISNSGSLVGVFKVGTVWNTLTTTLSAIRGITSNTATTSVAPRRCWRSPQPPRTKKRVGQLFPPAVEKSYPAGGRSYPTGANNPPTNFSGKTSVAFLRQAAAPASTPQRAIGAFNP